MIEQLVSDLFLSFTELANYLEPHPKVLAGAATLYMAVSPAPLYGPRKPYSLDQVIHSSSQELT